MEMITMLGFLILWLIGLLLAMMPGFLLGFLAAFLTKASKLRTWLVAIFGILMGTIGGIILALIVFKPIARNDQSQAAGLIVLGIIFNIISGIVGIYTGRRKYKVLNK